MDVHEKYLAQLTEALVQTGKETEKKKPPDEFLFNQGEDKFPLLSSFVD
jgi:hypothetical protein